MYGLILAGAEGIKGAGDLEYKAGLSLGTDTMLDRAIEAVSRIKKINRIIVVGSENLINRELRRKVWRVLSPGDSFFSNLELGMASIPGDEEVLVVASDLPHITTEACADFLAQCSRRQADIFYPVIAKDVYEQAYPGSKRTYLQLQDNTYTGGNLVLMKTAFFRRHRGLVKVAISLRKQPWILAFRFGLNFWLRFLQKRISLNCIEKLVEKKYKFKGAAIVSHYSEMGLDIDTVEDIKWLQYYWNGISDGWEREEETEEWLM